MNRPWKILLSFLIDETNYSFVRIRSGHRRPSAPNKLLRSRATVRVPTFYFADRLKNIRRMRATGSPMIDEIRITVLKIIYWISVSSLIASIGVTWLPNSQIFVPLRSCKYTFSILFQSFKRVMYFTVCSNPFIAANVHFQSLNGVLYIVGLFHSYIFAVAYVYTIKRFSVRNSFVVTTRLQILYVYAKVD